MTETDNEGKKTKIMEVLTIILVILTFLLVILTLLLVIFAWPPWLHNMVVHLFEWFLKFFHPGNGSNLTPTITPIITFSIPANITPISTKDLLASNSGISAELGKPVDMNFLHSRVSQTYDIIRNDSYVIIWKYSGTTGDTAYVFSDGRHLVASSAALNLAAKDSLEKEMQGIIDLKGTIVPISDTEKQYALDHATYYSTNSGVFHRIKYSYGSDFDMVLKVPVWSLKEARLTVEGGDAADCCGFVKPGQGYSIDEVLVTSCCADPCGGHCGGCIDRHCLVDSVDIAAKLTPGDRKLTATWISDQHVLLIEAITAPTEKRLVLHGPNSQPWIEDTTHSLSKESMISYVNP